MGTKYQTVQKMTDQNEVNEFLKSGWEILRVLAYRRPGGNENLWAEEPVYILGYPKASQDDELAG